MGIHACRHNKRQQLLLPLLKGLTLQNLSAKNSNTEAQVASALHKGCVPQEAVYNKLCILNVTLLCMEGQTL